MPEREDINVSHAAKKKVKANQKYDKKKSNGKTIQNGRVGKVETKKKFNKTMKTAGKNMAVKNLSNGK